LQSAIQEQSKELAGLLPVVLQSVIGSAELVIVVLWTEFVGSLLELAEDWDTLLMLVFVGDAGSQRIHTSTDDSTGVRDTKNVVSNSLLLSHG